MSPTFLDSGEFFATLCAALWAVSVVLFRLSGAFVPPVALNLFKNTVALTCFVITLMLLGRPLVPAEQGLGDWLILLVSGVLGIGVADSLFFASLNRIGLSRSAIVDCCYSPFVVLGAVLILHEPLRLTLVLAIVLMVCAILFGTWTPGREELSFEDRQVRQGVLLGVAAMWLTALSVILAKPVLLRADPWWATTVRLLGGMAVLSLQGLSPTHREATIRVFRPGAAWRVALPAALIGSYFGMFFWILGWKYAATTTASVLNQLSTIFAVVLAWLFLREPLTRRRAVAVGAGFLAAVVAVW